MKISKINSMTRGWFVGDFEPSSFKSSDFEVGYLTHKKGEQWDLHYHEECIEINLLVRGKLSLQNKILESGDIFVLDPFEISDAVFLEDCEIVCVKSSSKKYDKIKLKKI